VIVLDASVLIAHLDSRDAQHDRALQALTAAGGEPLGASVITLAEVLVGPARAGRLDDARLALEELDVTSVALPPDAAVRLASLRAQTTLHLPDCCVLLAAQTESASILTFDERQGKAATQFDLDVVD
jgi:predicted nucleic acid-binding protein